MNPSFPLPRAPNNHNHTPHPPSRQNFRKRTSHHPIHSQCPLPNPVLTERSQKSPSFRNDWKTSPGVPIRAISPSLRPSLALSPLPTDLPPIRATRATLGSWNPPHNSHVPYHTVPHRTAPHPTAITSHNTSLTNPSPVPNKQFTYLPTCLPAYLSTCYSNLSHRDIYLSTSKCIECIRYQLSGIKYQDPSARSAACSSKSKSESSFCDDLCDLLLGRNEWMLL